ncbi:MAG: NOL1/NOP2/sun family putative RNA methylase [Candidatus Micrarchaeota archaeon]
MEQQEFLDWLGTYTDANLFLESLLHKKDSFRVNTLKISNHIFDTVSQLKCHKLSWYADARICPQPIQLGNTFEYFLGYLHPQGLSSMIPPLVLAPEENDYVLDICASPGSKATQIAALMKNGGTLVANDLPEREMAIVPNIARLGVLNVIVTNRDAKEYPLKREFTKVLADVPCTALGSKLHARERFSLQMAGRMSAAQEKIILKSFDSLVEGGTLVYSTCTVAPQECEEVVQFLLHCREEAHVENIALDMPHENGLSEYGSEIAKTWRVYPQHIGSEGFYIAKISKGSL